MNNYEKQGTISQISIILCICSLILTAIVIGNNFHATDDVNAIVWSKMVLFSLTGYLFAFESLNMIVPVLKTAPTIDSGTKYFNISIFTCAVLYSLIAVTLYMQYGSGINVIFFHCIDGQFAVTASHIYILSVQLGFGIQYLLAHEMIQSLIEGDNNDKSKTIENYFGVFRFFLSLIIFCLFSFQNF